MVDTVPQPPLPFVLEMQIASGFAPREGSAVGAGLVFGYKRPAGVPESFYALLLAGNTATLYHRHDGTFDEAARTSIPASRGGGGPSWVSVRVALRENGFSLSLNGDGEISQDAADSLSGRYGVMASGAGEAAMRNLGIR